MKKTASMLLCIVFTVVTMLTVTVLEPSVYVYAYTEIDEHAPVETQIIVHYTDTSAGRSSLVLHSASVAAAQKLSDTMDLIQCSSSQKVDPLISELEARSDVEAVNENYTLQMFSLPNDHCYDLQYYYDMVGALENWDTEPSNNPVTVAVIDTGLAVNNVDLSSRYTGGYDFYLDRARMTDTNFHGTAVSGIIAAEANNKKCITGLAGKRNIKIVPFRMSAGSTSNGYIAELAIERAIEQGVDVINMSFGTDTYIPTLNNVIQKAHQKGITLVASAGNGAERAAYTDYKVKIYPASFDNVISVASINSNKTHSYFSQYNNSVDLCAPGEGIITTVPYHISVKGFDSNGVNGTSFSAPMVSAAAAILKSYNDKLTPEQIEALLKGTATDLGTKGYDVYYGYGLINIEKAIKNMYPDSISLDNFSIPCGIPVSIPVTTSPKYATIAGSKYLSSDDTVATIDSYGMITGHKPGSAVITIITGDGKTVKATVTVTENLILRVNDSKTILNGIRTYMPDGIPQVINGRTMVPMRYVFESMDCSVKYTSMREPIVVSYNDTMVHCTIGNSKMYVFSNDDVRIVTLDSPPLIINGRTYLPVRAISESLGFGVYYDNDTKIICVTKPRQSNEFCQINMLPYAKDYY